MAPKSSRRRTLSETPPRQRRRRALRRSTVPVRPARRRVGAERYPDTRDDTRARPKAGLARAPPQCLLVADSGALGVIASRSLIVSFCRRSSSRKRRRSRRVRPARCDRQRRRHRRRAVSERLADGRESRGRLRRVDDRHGQVIHRSVKHLSSGDTCLRWTAAGMLEAENRSRTASGHRGLVSITVAIKTRSYPAPTSLPTNGSPPPSLCNHDRSLSPRFHGERGNLPGSRRSSKRRRVLVLSRRSVGA
jgi:hypothetical protein